MQNSRSAQKSETPPQHEVLFSPVSGGRAFDGITEQIRTQMAAGRLQAGTRLPPERVLATQFGVSRNTLREALRSLENSGVLVLKHGAQSGAYIKHSNGEGITTGLVDMYNLGAIKPIQLTEARIRIESAIVHAACEAALPEDIEAMEQNLLKALEYDREGRVLERISTNVDFHRIVARATHNPLLVAFMDATLDVMQMFIKTLGPYESNFVFMSRRRFIKYMTERNANAAALEMEKSLRRLQREYLSRLESLNN